MTRTCDKSAATTSFDMLLWEALGKDINERTALWKKSEGANFVPEEWATKALALQGVSEDALGYLARNLRTKGRLSLQHAHFFIGLVDNEQADARTNASIAATIRKTTTVRARAPCAIERSEQNEWAATV